MFRKLLWVSRKALGAPGPWASHCPVFSVLRGSEAWSALGSLCAGCGGQMVASKCPSLQLLLLAPLRRPVSQAGSGTPAGSCSQKVLASREHQRLAFWDTGLGMSQGAGPAPQKPPGLRCGGHGPGRLCCVSFTSLTSGSGVGASRTLSSRLCHRLRRPDKPELRVRGAHWGLNPAVLPGCAVRVPGGAVRGLPVCGAPATSLGQLQGLLGHGGRVSPCMRGLAEGPAPREGIPQA